MADLLVLNAQDVQTSLPMATCMDAMAQAAICVHAGEINVPQRTFAALRDERGVLALMPATAAKPPVFGLKAMSLMPDNPAQGRPLIQGFVALFSQETGAPVALVDGARVTAIRTGAASGVATRTLARPDAQSHAILGTGVQAITHAQAIAAACPHLEETRIWGRDFNKAQAVAARLSAILRTKVTAARKVSDATSSDVISAVTASASPLIKHTDVRPGAHINLVGSHTPDKREACSQTLASARLYVDGHAAALKEAGDILIPLREKVISEDHIIAELGAVLSGKAPGRLGQDDITIYKSLGNAAQDMFAAWTLYIRALETGAGQKVAL